MTHTVCVPKEQIFDTTPKGPSEINTPLIIVYHPGYRSEIERKKRKRNSRALHDVVAVTSRKDVQKVFVKLL